MSSSPVTLGAVASSSSRVSISRARRSSRARRRAVRPPRPPRPPGPWRGPRRHRGRGALPIALGPLLARLGGRSRRRRPGRGRAVRPGEDRLDQLGLLQTLVPLDPEVVGDLVQLGRDLALEGALIDRCQPQLLPSAPSGGSTSPEGTSPNRYRSTGVSPAG